MSHYQGHRAVTTTRNSDGTVVWVNRGRAAGKATSAFGTMIGKDFA